MYIALKWLIGMALAMWIVLCLVDLNKTNVQLTETYAQHLIVPLYKNTSAIVQKTVSKSKKKLIHSRESQNNIYLHYIMFFVGACTISIFNRKQDILLYTRRKIKTINIMEIRKYIGHHFSFKKTAFHVSVAILKSIEFMKAMKEKIVKIKSFIYREPLASTPSINLVLINKLRILDQERKNLGQLLIAVIQENKQIKMRYQLETMAKTRLTQYVEDSHRQIRENRSRYISFQQLYLIAHQENIFLKSRLKRLTKEKEDAERNLIELVNQVCLSKNNDLKNFCSRFIVNTHSNLLNCNVRHEINRFLQKSNVEGLRNVFENTIRKDDLNELPPKPLEISEFFDEEHLISLVKDAPKLRGLPGEYVWTVKDKDGIIEKLYEYDSGFDNGDTIRRIREYSVYCDKECLLDFPNSTTFVNNEKSSSFQNRPAPFFIANHRFLTGSQAFQKFLQNNKNFTVHRSKPIAIVHKLENLSF